MEDLYTTPLKSSAPMLPSYSFISPLRSSLSGGVSSSDVWDSIEEVQEHVALLHRTTDRIERQVKSFMSSHHNHCDHLAQVYTDLEDFVHLVSVPGSSSAHKPVTSSPQSSHEKEQPTTAHSSPPPPCATSSMPEGLGIEEVHALFSDFREEIVSQRTFVTAQVTQLQANIDDVKQMVAQCKEQIPSGDAIKAMIKTAVDAAIKSYAADNKKEQDRRETDIRRSFDKRMGKAEKSVYKELDDRNSNNLKLMEKRIEEQLTAYEQSKTDTNHDRAEILHRCVDALDVAVNSVIVDVHRLQEEKEESVEKEKEKKKEEEARSKVQREEARENVLLSQLQVKMSDDFSRFHKQMRDHEEELEKLRSHGPWEGAFMEIKDWLTDLEKRSASRGDLMELKHRIDEELSRLRKALYSAPRPAGGTDNKEAEL